MDERINILFLTQFYRQWHTSGHEQSIHVEQDDGYKRVYNNIL